MKTVKWVVSPTADVDVVHGNPLLPGEIRVQIDHMDSSRCHPKYDYPLEVGGYAAWSADCCIPFAA